MTPALDGSDAEPSPNLELEQLRARVVDLEAALAEATRPPIGARLRERASYRMGLWRAPRLGTLAQHAPTKLRVPRRQLLLRPPADPPTIAMVTPSYNQGRFLERTIRSVLDQRYPALEYVVQDGASDDATPTILDAYRSRLHACKSEPDSGQGEAIDRGFAKTSGEIMGWLNSDDLLMPGALAAVSRHFANHPETDVVYGHRVLIDHADRQTGCWIMPRHEDWTLEVADLVPQETLFWRRSVWDASGGTVDTGYRYALDWDLLLRFKDAGARFVRLPYLLGGFRVHDDQKTTRDLDVGLTEIEAIRESRLGRPVSHAEAWRRLDPYLRRHVARHSLHRVARRIPGLHAEI